MKVLCIDNGFNNILQVTIGKWYEIDEVQFNREVKLGDLGV